MADQGKPLPFHVQKEFNEYLKCGALNMAFCGYNAVVVIKSIWSPSVANDVEYVRAAAPDYVDVFPDELPY